MITSKDILDIFTQKYGKVSVQVAAPGRANIIGEHTDYNDGYVLPFAINKRIYFAAGYNSGDHFKIYSFNLDKEVSIYPDQKWNKGFARFFSSVINVLNKHGYKLSGLNIVFGGDLPIGGGMSSSSSVTCGFIALLDAHLGLGLSKDDMVSLAVEAEHGVGVAGGHMDQYSIVNGVVDRAILLDCLDGTSQLIELELGDKIFCLFDTNVSHNLEDTDYNTRSSTCKRAINKVRAKHSEVKNFRDLSINDLDILTDIEKQRVIHVIEENQRVLDTVESFKNSDLCKVGDLLNRSHVSLRDQYEVSCEELDFLQSKLIEKDGVLGARMMGGGFGGSVIALLHADALKEISLTLAHDYKERFGLVLDVYPIKPEVGLTVSTLTQ